MRLKVQDVHNLLDRIRVVVDFDEFSYPIGEAIGLLAGVCGQLATDSLLFPINIKKWSNMPDTFRDRQWDHFLMVPDEGSGVVSPNDSRRSRDRSNTQQSVDISSPH